MNKLYSELKSEIDKAESIIIFSHVNADGDTLGSNLALAEIIKNEFGKKADSVYIGNLPKTYKYLPGYETLINICDINQNKRYDLAIAVDVASKDRLVSGTDIFDNAKSCINIDHHKTNIGYGKLNIVEPDAACAGAILYKIFKEWDSNITVSVARCLYTSLMTDTGGFKYENTTPETFITAADLVSKGVSPNLEYRACYETKPQSMIQFQAYTVSNAFFYDNGRIAIAKITRSDLSKFNARDEYTEGIAEILRTSEDVEISAILKETKEGYTKISLRSKTIDVTPIVSDFGGGGHAFAAGCTIKKPIAVAFDKILSRIQSELE